MADPCVAGTGNQAGRLSSFTSVAACPVALCFLLDLPNLPLKVGFPIKRGGRVATYRKEISEVEAVSILPREDLSTANWPKSAVFFHKIDRKVLKECAIRFVYDVGDPFWEQNHVFKVVGVSTSTSPERSSHHDY